MRYSQSWYFFIVEIDYSIVIRSRAYRRMEDGESRPEIGRMQGKGRNLRKKDVEEGKEFEVLGFGIILFSKNAWR